VTTIAEKTSIAVLELEYKSYVDTLRAAWIRENYVRSKDVYEVMSEMDRARVNQRMRAWDRYITPLVEKWWEDRGYVLVWPENDTDPVLIKETVPS
jgi:hypothetical protein